MRNISLDYMKFFLSIMVVGIHTTFFSEINEAISFVFTQGIFRVAVPIFFIINGYYFFGAINSGKAKDWLLKILSLYLAWSAIYAYYWIDLGSGSLLDWIKLIHTIMFGYFHLWYLPAVIGAAIIINCCRRLSLMWLAVFIVCSFFSGVFIQYFGNYHLAGDSVVDKFFNMGWVYRNFIFFGFPFFGMGYLLAKYFDDKKITLGQSAFLAALGICSIVLESYINFNLIGSSERFDLLASLLISSPLIFILFKKITILNSKINFSLVASGIYFIHPMAIYFLWNYGFRPTVLTLVVVLFSIFLTTILIEVNKKLKFLL